MSRDPYNFAVAGSCTWIDGNNPPIHTLVEGARFTESSTGTTRPKPRVKFIPPANYSFFKRSYQNAYGSSKRTYKPANVPSLGYKFEGVIGFANGSNGRFVSVEHFGETMSEEDTVLSSNLLNQVLIKTRNKVKGRGVNLGIAFAERNATARLIGDTASNLAKAYRNLRRGNVRAAMDALGVSSSRREPRGSNAPSKWLELQYGWKPLLSDVYGSVKALNERNKDDWRVTVTGRVQDVTTHSYKRIGYDAFTMQARRLTSAFCRIDAFPNNEALISLQSLGITNPLLVGWELVPFSFVVDWFYPLGGYLESLDAMLGFGETYSSTSLLIRAEWNGSGNNYEDNTWKFENSFTENKRFVKLSRTASAGVPQAKLPSLKDPRSLGHMANGLSLLATVFGRR